MLIKLVITMMLFELPLNPVNLLLFSVIGLVREVLSLYFYILLIVVVASWLMRDYVHPVLAALNRMVNPLLAPFRKGIPPIAGFDFSPLILLIIIKFLEIILASFTI